jgi:hypothetical protein
MPPLVTFPFDVAQCAKNLFGHVGPGIDEYQWSQIANCCASALNTRRLDAELLSARFES